MFNFPRFPSKMVMRDFTSRELGEILHRVDQRIVNLVNMDAMGAIKTMKQRIQWLMILGDAEQKRDYARQILEKRQHWKEGLP